MTSAIPVLNAEPEDVTLRKIRTVALHFMDAHPNAADALYWTVRKAAGDLAAQLAQKDANRQAAQRTKRHANHGLTLISGGVR